MSDNDGIDVVDSSHEDRDCPYCGRRQRWIDDGAEKYYFHLSDCLRWCDEERLAHWDVSESWQKTRDEADQ